MLSDMQVNRIVDNIMNTGGATFNNSGVVSYLNGYQLGIAGVGRAHRLGVNPLLPVPVSDRRSEVEWHVRSFIARKGDLLDEDMGFDLGAWLHEGTLYLDVTLRYADRELALQRARETGELSVWDWANGEAIDA